VTNLHGRVTLRGRPDIHNGCHSFPEMLKIGPIDVTDLLGTGEGGLT